MSVSSALAAKVRIQHSTRVSFANSQQDGFYCGGRILRVSQKDSEINSGVRRSARPHAQAPTAPAASYQSPVPQQPQQLSPMSQMAPPMYGSPYVFHNPFYGYGPGSIYTDGQHYYQPPAAYSPAYYPSYPSSPSYDATSSSAGVAASPTSYPYYGYGYQYSPAPYWGTTSPSVGQQASASPYYPPAYSPPVSTTATTVAEDRSATPTPAGHSSVEETSLESQ